MKLPTNNQEEKIVILGETTFRNERKKFGMKVDDRRRHTYVIGKTGMGKTSLVESMAIQDIQAGRGVAFVDPHGDAAERLLDFIPPHRKNDVIYFDPADIDYPIGFNIMENVDPDKRHVVASGLMGVFKKIWPDVWSARMEYILNNTVLALLEYPGSTLLGINRMLSDADFRQKVIEKIQDPVVKAYWVNEFSQYSKNFEVEATAAVQNKVGQFISAPLIRNIVGQVKSSFQMRQVMDEGKILIVNLSKGKIGEDNSMLLGALLITKLQLAAMSRVDIPEAERKDFFLYVDEFQNFATESFAHILSEARKYRLALILGHQYVSQLEEEVRDAIWGNVGTFVSFRIGAEDAEFIEKEFTPEFTASDFVNLSKYHVYIKLMIDGATSRPFSAQTLPPLPVPEESPRAQVVRLSRERYGIKREDMEEKIKKWMGFLKPAEGSQETRSGEQKAQLYDAQCWVCGKKTKVTFQPDGVRPVYCKSCLQKKELEEKIEKTMQKALGEIQEKKEEKQEEKKGFLDSFVEAVKQGPVGFKKGGKVKEEPEEPEEAPSVDELKKKLQERSKNKEQ